MRKKFSKQNVYLALTEKSLMLDLELWQSLVTVVLYG